MQNYKVPIFKRWEEKEHLAEKITQPKKNRAKRLDFSRKSCVNHEKGKPNIVHMGWGLWDQRVQGVEEERIFGSDFL